MKKIILLLIILFLNSCKNEVEEVLVTDDKWFLKVVENNKETFLGQSFKFKSDGTYQYYPFVDNIEGGTETFDLHSKPERKWLLINDSLFLGDRHDKNFSYKIVKLNSHVLWLKNGVNNFVLTKKLK